MNYVQAVEYIESLGSRGIRPGLKTMEMLMSAMDNPEKKLRAIHIAGTNGKGSTGAFIAAGLMAAGISVGRYSSPAVLDNRDKLTYNGEWISCKEYAEAVCAARAAAEKSGAEPTPFEAETAAAIWWLYKKKCDIAIIETGMGGRFDATNVIDKLIAVITPIAMDHTKFLGSTLEEIAKEKAGIITDLAVSAHQCREAAAVLRNKCPEIVFAAEPENIVYYEDRTVFDYKSYKGVEIDLLGKYQTENAATAIEVFERLNKMGYNIDISSCMKRAEWHCRFERLSQNPEVFIDGAHNPHGAYALAENIRQYIKNKKTAFVVGVLADKDYNKIAEITAGLADVIYTVHSESPRALPSSELAAAFSKYNANTIAVGDIKEAVALALECEAVVIFGSLTIMREAYGFFRGEDMYNTIIKNETYKRAMAGINKSEKDRVFCRHGIDHSLDVARIAYIISLERKLNISKRLIYTTALLHDIGRSVSGDNHDMHSARIAADIMRECGYDESDISLVTDAIKVHRTKSDQANSLNSVISIADKLSRRCYDCVAYGECYWKSENKNKYIDY